MIPEWKDAFVDYRQLKKHVKKIKLALLRSSLPSSSSPDGNPDDVAGCCDSGYGLFLLDSARAFAARFYACRDDHHLPVRSLIDLCNICLSLHKSRRNLIRSVVQFLFFFPVFLSILGSFRFSSDEKGGKRQLQKMTLLLSKGGGSTSRRHPIDRCIRFTSGHDLVFLMPRKQRDDMYNIYMRMYVRARSITPSLFLLVGDSDLLICAADFANRIEWNRIDPYSSALNEGCEICRTIAEGTNQWLCSFCVCW